MDVISQAGRVFNTSRVNGRTISPPEQVFLNQDLVFLVVGGGSHLAAN